MPPKPGWSLVFVLLLKSMYVLKNVFLAWGSSTLAFYLNTMEAEDCKLEAILGYNERPYLKKKC